MQQFNIQNNAMIIPAPASSRALTKLKNDKLIPARQSNQPMVMYQGSNVTNARPLVKFNNVGEGQVISNSPSMPILSMQRQDTACSGLSSSQSIKLNQSQVTQSNFTQVQPTQPGLTLALGMINPSSNSQQSPRPQQINESNKPLSAFQRPPVLNQPPSINRSNSITNNNVDNTPRLRSSSASQFTIPNSNVQSRSQVTAGNNNNILNNSINNNNINNINNNSNNLNNTFELQRRIQQNQSKLIDANRQILQCNNNLLIKQKRVSQLELEITQLRKRNIQVQIQIKKYTQGQGYRGKRLSQLQQQNKILYNKKVQIQSKLDQKTQKITSLQSSLAKILQSKNIQIQSLTQSCKQLSKNIQDIHQKYQQQIKKLNKNINQLKNVIMENDKIVGELGEKLVEMEEKMEIKNNNNDNKDSNTNNNKELVKSEQSLQPIQKQSHLIQQQNKVLKLELSSYISQLQQLQKIIRQKEQQNNELAHLKKQLDKLTVELEIQRKNNQKSREIVKEIQGKLKEVQQDNQRIVQERDLQREVEAQRKKVFQRQIIYQLKHDNDRLWSKLIQQSDQKANIIQGSEQYWMPRVQNVTNIFPTRPNIISNNNNNHHHSRHQSHSHINTHTHTNTNANKKSPNPTHNPSPSSSQIGSIHHQQIQQIKYNKNNILRQTPRFQNNYNQRENMLAEQYRMFVQKLEQQQGINYHQNNINNNNNNNVNNININNTVHISADNLSDYKYYHKKCQQLQQIIAQHLKINSQLQNQLQQNSLTFYNTTNHKLQAQLQFIKSQLQKQRTLNQTLNRANDLIKEEYQARFKHAQRKLEEIQGQNRRSDKQYNKTNNNSNFERVNELQRQVQSLQIQISTLTVRISQLNRYQSLYQQAKQKLDQMSPISHFKSQAQSQNYSDIQKQNLKRQNQILIKMYKQKQQQIIDVTAQYNANIRKLQNQLKMKNQQFQMLYADFQKVTQDFRYGQMQYRQILQDVARLEKQLQQHKSVSGSNRKSVESRII